MIKMQSYVMFLILLLCAALRPALCQSLEIRKDTAIPSDSSTSTSVQSEISHDQSGISQSADNVEAPSSVIVKSGVTAPDVHVTNGRTDIQGKVHGSIYAVNSEVVIEKGAYVGGNVYMVGGTFQNLSSQRIVAIKLTQDQFDHLPVTHSIVRQSVDSERESDYSGEEEDPQSSGTVNLRDISGGAWLGGQFGLLIFGLLAALLAQTAASQTTHKAALTAYQETSRSMLTGLISAGLILMTLAILHPLAHTFLGFAASPLLTIVSLFTMVLLVFGWLCGLLALGNHISMNIGRAPEGSLFYRIASILCLFILFNISLGLAFHLLGAIVLLSQAGISILGLGALVANVLDFRNRRSYPNINSSSIGKFEWQ